MNFPTNKNPFHYLMLSLLVLMLGASDASAQYVSKDEAIKRIQTEIGTLKQQPQTNYTVSLMMCFKHLASDLSSSNVGVKEAIISTTGKFQANGTSTSPLSTKEKLNHPAITKTELENLINRVNTLLHI